MPIVWAWEYGDRTNKTEIKEKWWPLVKGQVDFFSCFLQKNETDDGYLHDLHDCTNESPGVCPGMDTTLTISLMKRSFDIAADMAAFLGEPVDPQWAVVLEKTAPLGLGWFYVPNGFNNSGPADASHECSWCGGFNNSRTNITKGPCSPPYNTRSPQCVAADKDGTCPAGTGPCSQQAIGSMRQADGRPGRVSGGNSQSIFPAFPADYVGTNSSLSAAAANTVMVANSWQQGNSFTKIFSAAARVVAPGLLTAELVYREWIHTLTSTQQPNFIPFNPFSGFETVGAIEYVQYMLLQSDPAGFLGLFEAWPRSAGDASFTRLRARGGFVVSSSFVNSTGKVGTTTLVSKRGSHCVLRRPQSWPKASIKVIGEEGSAVPVEWEAGGSDFMAFQTKTGASYTISGE